MSVETFVSPASFAQRRLWFIHQLEPESPLYHIPMLLQLGGELDVGALRRSLETIVARHEALRTTFTVQGDEPMQIIAPPPQLPMPVTDLADLAAEEQEATRRHLVTEEVTQRFDLERGPLLRARLLRLAPDEHLLIVVVHHIVFDGWSAGVLSRELSVCYRAFASGEAPVLPELPIQYADYAVWQREWLKGDTLQRQLDYWRRRLAGAPTVLDLPTDFPRPERSSYRGATEAMLLPAEVLGGLKALARAEQASLFMTLLAAFQSVLGRYTGRDDFLIGSPIANRTRSELEPLIGFFVNSLVFRADLTGNPSFRQLLRRVRESALDGYAHQDLPFERLVEELRPERVADRNPLFQVMVTLQNVPQTRLALRGLTLRRMPRRGSTSKFDLTLLAQEEGRGLRLRMEYRAELFEPATIRRMLGHLEMLLRGVIAEPDRRLSTVSLLTGAERTHAASDWNRTARAYPDQARVQSLVEEQVRARPEAVAVEAGTERLTYAELNRRANRLAWHLREHGVEPDARVGIALERSPDLIVALLAVLKAGGAYVPLDLGYPAARLHLMMQDAGIAVLLCRGAPPAGTPPGTRTIDLLAEPDGVPDLDPEPLGTSENLAYVTYTSGSTGRPKGIAIPHRAITRLVCNTDYVRLEPADCIAQVSNASFDALTFEVWGALVHGARLAIMDREVVLSARTLAAELRRRGVTTMFLTTALFNQLTQEVPDLVAPLRQVLVGGEALDPRRIRAVLREGRPGRLLNGYGPTETTTFATWHQIESVPDDALTIPIGRPIANTTAYVLDRFLEPVPLGVAGELYLGGPGLARGYLGRPGLTAERFIPDPFGPPGGRLYRTGDRVRRRADGVLEFLGRLDAQVKLRGFRVEPGEVEAVLGQHPHVRDCAVAVRDDAAGGPALVAYLTPRASAGSNGSHADPQADSGRLTRALRAHLRERLPDFMVPSAFVVLEALPLSPNGKVDRAALPPADARHVEPDAEAALPVTPVEKELAGVWRTLLGVDRISLDDNFFELGGHSLLAVRLFAEIERIFERRLPLSTLFQAPTLGQLAQALSATGPAGGGSALVPLQRGTDSAPPLFLLHGYYGHVLDYHEMVRRLRTDRTIFGCEIPIDEQDALKFASIEELATYHLRYLRRQQPTGPYHLGGYCWGGLVAFELARQLRLAGEDVGLLALIDCPFPGFRQTRSLASRARGRARLGWELVRQNVARVRELAPRQIPPFLWQRLVNLVTRVAGRPAYRWSVRIGRPLLPAFRELANAFHQAGLAYRPGTYPGRIQVLYAAGNRPGRSVDAFAGWTRVATGGVEFYEVPGMHRTMMQEPHVERLSTQLLAILERPLAEPATE